MDYPVSQLRAAYFAIVKILGQTDEADRHALNLDLGLPASTRAWSPRDWAVAVSLLQRATGRTGIVVGQPHLRGGVTSDFPFPLDSGATAPQQRAIAALAAQMDWRHPGGPAAGLEALIRKRVLRLGTSAEIQWHGSLATLDRKQASLTIIILDREPKVGRASSLPSEEAGKMPAPPATGYSSFLARESDPETSQDAAEAAVESGRVAIDEQAIMFVLREASPEGMTGSEIAGRLLAAPGQSPWNNVRVMRRMAALIGAGKVHRIEGQRRDGQALHFYGPAGMPLQNAAKVPV